MKPVICHIMVINNKTFIHQLVKLALYFKHFSTYGVGYSATATAEGLFHV